MTHSTLQIPCNYEDFQQEQYVFTEWWPEIIFDFFNTSDRPQHKREHEVLRHRFGLDGHSRRTLEEIGIIFDVSRERIRQIEKDALDALTLLINTGKHEQRHIELVPFFNDQLAEYKQRLCSLNPVETEETIIEQTQDFFSLVSITKADLPTLRLLLVLLGFKPVALETQVGEESEAWALGQVNVKRLQSVLETVFKCLRDVVLPISYADLKVAVNSGRSARSRFTDSEIKQAIDLLEHDIEVLDDETMRVRFDRLRSITDKAYRIMHEQGEPVHARDLARILNKEAFKSGERSRLGAHNIGSRLSGDSRFQPIGRSGEWILSEWENISTDHVLDLMEDALHSVGEPLSAQEIFEFVSKRRPVKTKAVDSYLRMDSRFVRVGKNQFALADWGMQSVSYALDSARKRVLSKAKLCEYIELVFADQDAREMYVADLVQEISRIEPELKSSSINNQVLKSPAIKIERRHEGKQTRLVATFVPSYHTKLSKRDVLTKDVTLTELIQNNVRGILRKHTRNQAPLVVLRDSISSELQCPPATVYHAISEMNDIEKFKDDSNQFWVRLVSVTGDFDSTLAQISDKKLVAQLQRALALLHIDTVDLALFQLGKIFEHTLQNYMLEVQAKGIYPVSSGDLSKLNNMVQWAGKTGVITDQTALHYLRIERNDRGHGSPPELDERQALLGGCRIFCVYS